MSILLRKILFTMQGSQSNNKQYVLQGNVALPLLYNDYVFQADDSALMLFGWAKVIMIIRSHAQYAYQNNKIDESKFNEYHEMIEKVFAVKPHQKITVGSIVQVPEHLDELKEYLSIIEKHFFSYKNRLQKPSVKYFNDSGEFVNGWKLQHEVLGVVQEGIIIEVKSVKCLPEKKSFIVESYDFFRRFFFL